MKTLFTLLLFALLSSCTKGPGDIASQKGGSSEQGNAFSGISGQAVYPGGRIAVGVAVILHQPISSMPLTKIKSNQANSKFTDSLGRYSFPDADTGVYYIEVNDGSTSAFFKECHVVDREKLTDLGIDTLKLYGSINGRINIQGSVSDYNGFYSVIWELGRYVNIDNTGSFIIDSLPSGNYTLKCQSLYTKYIISVKSGVNVAPGKPTDVGTIQILDRSSIITDSLYQNDTLAVRAILDSNNILLPVSDFTWIERNRIVYFQYSGNFSVVPDPISRLTALKYFGVQGINSFVQLPLRVSDQINKLDSLQIIELTRVNLINIPIAIYGIKSLEMINLSGNKIDSLPKAIFTLTNLKTLRLAQNQIRVLPSDVRALKSLRILDLSSNRLTFVSPELGQMDNLTDLMLNQNLIDSLPEEIGNLSNLERLSLSNNKLQMLPYGIIHLNCVVDIAYNQLCNVQPVVINWLDIHFCRYLNCGDNYEGVDWKKNQTCP